MSAGINLGRPLHTQYLFALYLSLSLSLPLPPPLSLSLSLSLRIFMCIIYIHNIHMLHIHIQSILALPLSIDGVDAVQPAGHRQKEEQQLLLLTRGQMAILGPQTGLAK